MHTVIRGVLSQQLLCGFLLKQIFKVKFVPAFLVTLSLNGMWKICHFFCSDVNEKQCAWSSWGVASAADTSWVQCSPPSTPFNYIKVFLSEVKTSRYFIFYDTSIVVYLTLDLIIIHESFKQEIENECTSQCSRRRTLGLAVFQRHIYSCTTVSSTTNYRDAKDSRIQHWIF